MLLPAKKSITVSSDLPASLCYLGNQINGLLGKSLTTFLSYITKQHKSCFSTLNVHIKPGFNTLFVLLVYFMVRKRAKDVYEAVIHQA